MLSDRIFKNALIVSVIFHIFIFYNWPPLGNLAILKPSQDIKLTYYPLRRVPEVSKFIAKKQKKGSLAMDGTGKGGYATTKKRELARPLSDLRARDKFHTKKDAIEENKALLHIPSDAKILISHNEKDFSSEPTYLNYYNGVRAKIYKAANANKSYYFMEGEVRLAFTLARSGSLLKVAIVEEGSTTNPILRSHALMSVKRASPFVPFLDSMKEDHLTLRLTIAFEK